MMECICPWTAGSFMHTYCTLGITNKDGVRLTEKRQKRNIDTLFVALLRLLFLNLLQVQVREESCQGLGEAVGILLYLLLGRMEREFEIATCSVLFSSL